MPVETQFIKCSLVNQQLRQTYQYYLSAALFTHLKKMVKNENLEKGKEKKLVSRKWNTWLFGNYSLQKHSLRYKISIC